MSLRPGWLSFGRYAGFTTGMTLALFTLGVYTAATGSGLACQAQWPLCSDQLIPALTLNPDFIEWFHRVWAMLTGFLIIGMAVWAWRLEDRRIRLAATLAVLVLPLQIAVGAITVTVGGLVPQGYSVSTHALHLVVALIIFTLLGLATFWAWSDDVVSIKETPSESPAESVETKSAAQRLGHIRIALVVGLGFLIGGALFSRAVPIVTYSPGAQALFYGSTLAAYLALLSVVVRTADVSVGAELSRVRTSVFVAIALVVFTLLLGRDIVYYAPTVQLVNLVALGGALLGVVLAITFLSRDARGAFPGDGTRVK